MSKKKKKRHLRKSIKVSLLACACLITGTFLFRSCTGSNQKEEVEQVTAQSSSSPSSSPESNTHSFRLFLLGDALTQEQLLAQAQQADGSWDFSMFDDITDQAKEYDLAFYNQESILGGDHLGISYFPTFNGPQAFGDYMVSKGFNLVSKANNHCLDRGEQAIHNSDAYWSSKAGVISTGTNESQAEQDAVDVHECNGITYAFNAWTYGMNGNVCPDGEEYLVNCYRDDPQKMLDWVKEADQKADVVIVSMHWGTEYTSQPDQEQMDLAQQLADAGADIIIGNHPHNIQPVTHIGDHAVVFYALGNGISSQDTTMGGTPESVLTGLIGSVTVTKTETDGTAQTSISDVRADVIYTTHDDNWGNIHGRMFKDLTDEELPDHDTYYQDDIRIIHAMDDSIDIGLE